MPDASLLYLNMMSTFSFRDYKDGIILAADNLGPRHQGRARRGSSSPPRPPSPLLPRTLSWAPSSETGPGCSRLPRRRLGRRCRRQRTPSGGWKPV